jgi:hypothetical protein
MFAYQRRRAEVLAELLFRASVVLRDGAHFDGR